MKLVNIYLFIDFSKNCNDLKSLIYILISPFRTYLYSLYFCTHNAIQYKNIFKFIVIKNDLDIIRIKKKITHVCAVYSLTFLCISVMR